MPVEVSFNNQIKFCKLLLFIKNITHAPRYKQSIEN